MTTTAKERIITSINQLNPAVDVTGPLTDLLARPFGAEIDSMDSKINLLRSLFSSDYNSARTDEEIDTIVASRSIIRDPGTYAVVPVTFRFSIRPSGIYVPAGALISTTDGAYQFSLLENFTPTEAQIDASFNSNTGRFEFAVMFQAVQIGEVYNIAATKLKKMNTSMPSGFSALNLVAATGGTDREQSSALWARYLSGGILSDLSSRVGIQSEILLAYPDKIIDLYVNEKISNFDPRLSQSVIEVYAIGETLTSMTETLTPVSGKVTLTKKPIRSITSVFDGSIQILLYDFNSKTNVLDILEVISGGTITVNYVYNSLIGDIQASVSQSSSDLFGYYIRINEGVPEPLRVKAICKVQKNILGVAIDKETLTNFILSYFNSLNFTLEDINPLDLTSTAKALYPGLISIDLTDFGKIVDSSFLIGFPVYVAPPKYPTLSLANLEVNVIAG